MKVLLLDNQGRKLGMAHYIPGHDGPFPSNYCREQGEGIWYENATCEWEGQAYKVTSRWDMSEYKADVMEEHFDWSEPDYMVLGDAVE